MRRKYFLWKDGGNQTHTIFNWVCKFKKCMKINAKNTKIIPFNFSKKFYFLPQLCFPESDPLEVIYTTRLLGVIVTSDLSWGAHVSDLCKRATKKLWILVAKFN